MKFIPFKHLVFVAMLASIASVVVSGCSSSSTTPPETKTIVTPKSGTTYTYAKHHRDSTSGMAPNTPPDTTIIAIVDSSNITFDGKSGVVKLLDEADTLRYILETSGDVSIYLKTFGSGGFFFTNPKPWMLLPFNSKTTNDTLFDAMESVTVQGNSIPVRVLGIADYVGTDEITKNGGKFASGGQVLVTITVSGQVLTTAVKITSTQKYSFDGSIGGYFHSISNTTVPDVVIGTFQVLQGRTSDDTKVLIDFNLIK